MKKIIVLLILTTQIIFSARQANKPSGKSSLKEIAYLQEVLPPIELQKIVMDYIPDDYRLLQSFQGSFAAMDITRDGKYIAVAPRVFGHEVYIYELKNGTYVSKQKLELKRRDRFSNPSIYAATFSPDGQKLAFVDSNTSYWQQDAGLRVFTNIGDRFVETGNFLGHDFSSVAFNGQYVAAAYAYAVQPHVDVWKIDNAGVIHKMQEITAPGSISNFSFSDDGTYLIISSRDRIEILKLVNGLYVSHQILTFANAGVNWLTFSSNGEYLATLEYCLNNIKIWQLTDGEYLLKQEIKFPPGKFTIIDLVLSADGKFLFVLKANGISIFKREREEYSEVATVPVEHIRGKIKSTADGSYIIAHEESGLIPSKVEIYKNIKQELETTAVQN